MRELERLLAITAAGYQLGVRGFLLASIARHYPVSNRAMNLARCGYDHQRLVEAAERIEQRLWAAPHKSQKTR